MWATDKSLSATRDGRPAGSVVAIAILIFVVLCCSCRRTGNQTWAGTGQPGPGKIAVVMTGWVEHPGMYYLDNNATLESALSAIGKFEGVGMDGKPPSRVTLWQAKDGTVERSVYNFRDMSKAQREAVHLHDGDRLEFTLRVF